MPPLTLTPEELQARANYLSAEGTRQSVERGLGIPAGNVFDAAALYQANATIAAALDRNTAALGAINETLNLIREDRLREGT